MPELTGWWGSGKGEVESGGGARAARLSPEQGSSHRLKWCWGALSTSWVLSSARARQPRKLHGTRQPIQIPALTFTSCETLSKSMNLLCLSFLDCKMGIIIVIPQRGFCKD